MSVQKAIVRAWTDEKYRDRLLSEPHAALVEAGVEIPAGVTVKVVENTADVQHLVLPVKPAEAGEVSLEELEKIAGGTRDGIWMDNQLQ